MNQTSRRPPPLAMLVAVTGMGPLALQLLVPSMPGLTQVFRTDFATIQLTLTLYLAGMAIGQLAYGPVSDRFGRRPTLLAGIGIFFAGSLACVFAPSIEFLVAGRIVQALGASAGMVLSRAIIRDVYPRDRAASMIGYVTMAMVLSPMVAPLIGSSLDDWFGWQSIFIFAALIGATILAFATVFLHESNHQRRATDGPITMVLSFARLLRIPAFNAYAFQGAFSSIAFFSFLGGGSYVAQEILGTSKHGYALCFLSLSGAYMLGNGLAGRISARVGGERMIWIGVCLGTAGALAGFLFSLTGMLNLWTLFAATAVVSVANGMALPNTMAGAVSVDPRSAGAAAGLAGFLQLAMGATAQFTVGLLLRDSAIPLMACMFIGTALGLACHAWGALHARRLTRA